MTEKKFKISKENEIIIREFVKDFRDTNKNIKNRTIENDIYCLEKLSDHLRNKNLKEATVADLKQFFRENKNFSGYNLLGTKLTIFYRWVEGLSKKEIPKRMVWFEYEKSKEKDIVEIKNELITEQEYKQLLGGSGRDRFGMWSALWETFYLTGARLTEIGTMQIKHVQLKEGKATIYVPESKTKTREIYFCTYPFYLERWIHTHPNRENLESPLWISNATNNFGDAISPNSIGMIFWKIKKKIKIKQNLSVHNFRKTRFTIMANLRSTDGGLIYSDSQLALFFGWKVNQVAARRQQYDLTGSDDLKNTVFSRENLHVEDYDIVKREKQQIEDKYEKELQELKKTVENLKLYIEESAYENGATVEFKKNGAIEHKN